MLLPPQSSSHSAAAAAAASLILFSNFPEQSRSLKKNMPLGVARSPSSTHHHHCVVRPNSGESDGDSTNIQPCDQPPEISFVERLGNATTLDIESSEFSWNTLLSLHPSNDVTSADYSEDEMNKALEVTVNSGGVVFYALFKTPKNDKFSQKEAAAVIKISSSRMATQSERLGCEFAKWLGVRTPQARVIHNSSPEWQQIKDATDRVRNVAVSSGDEEGEMTCTELLEALESSRCLFLMNYIHGSPLIENPDAFDAWEAAEKIAAALGRILMLDLILRNEDRLPCRQLGWRGNPANLLLADRVPSANIDALESMYGSAPRSYKPRVISALQKERRSNSDGRLGIQRSDSISPMSESFKETSHEPRKKQILNEIIQCEFHIVAIDSGVPRRPPAGKRAKDQEQYPKVVELVINNLEFSSSLLHEVSGGKLGVPIPSEAVSITDSCSSVSDGNVAAVVHEFRRGFRAALRDLQGFHIFLLTVYQKLDGLLRIFVSIINQISSESDKDDSGASESPCHPCTYGYDSLSLACKERISNETNAYLSDSDTQRCSFKYSSQVCRESLDGAPAFTRDNWNGRYLRGNGEPARSLRLTMKLRDFNKVAKVDAELNKELEQWNEMLRTDVIQLCQENNFNTGFFEGSDNNIVVDAYELKVRLEHILERISLISDAASTERPSPVTSYLFIGGALSARSVYTLQYLGITHILCLCANEIGQSDSQYPDLFEYKNFSINDDDDEDISKLFEEASDFIDYVEQLGGKILVHCFEGKSRSATVVLAHLMLRKRFTLLEAWNMLKKLHRRAQPNDGFAKTLLDLDKRLHGKVSMEWHQRKPMMKVCPICGKNAGLSSSSLKIHLQKSHRKISSGSVDSAMTLEIQKALETLKISRGGSISPNQKQSQLFLDDISS